MRRMRKENPAISRLSTVTAKGITGLHAGPKQDIDEFSKIYS